MPNRPLIILSRQKLISEVLFVFQIDRIVYFVGHDFRKDLLFEQIDILRIGSENVINVVTFCMKTIIQTE